MSFANLRSQRQSKQSRSFVQSSPAVASDIATSSAQPADNIDASTVCAGSVEVVHIDGLHKVLPAFLEIRRGESGRGIYCRKQSKAGTVLMSIRPHVSVLSTSYLDSYCSFCCGPSSAEGLKRCTRCRVFWYCGVVSKLYVLNQTCQNNDWPLHKCECVALQQWASSAPSPDLSVPGDAIRCLGRLLWSRQKEGLGSTWAREISMMQSHRSSLPASAFESHTHLAHSLVRYLGISSPSELESFGLVSAGDLVDLISRFTTNTFTLTSSSLTPIGVSVCPTIALTNHSCEPNAVIVFPRTSAQPQAQEPLMHLVTTKDIAPDEEVLVAYVDTTLPRDIRQSELRETYNFSCSCSLCANKVEVDPRASMWCPKSCGSTCPVPTGENHRTRCTRCKAAVASADEVLDALRLGQEALDRAASLQFKEPEKAKRITTNMISILTAAHLTPSCHPLLAITRLHQELLIASLPMSLTQELLNDTIRTAGKYSAGLSAILPPGHPVRGVALAELGKLLAVDEPSPFADPTDNKERFPPSGPVRLQLAYETLVHARDELVIGFGERNGGGQIGQEVREVIVRLENEMGVWAHGIKNVLEDTKAGNNEAKEKC